MTKLYNRTSDRVKRKLLRNNMTSAEKKLWKYIRKKQINGHKFRRQYSVCGFILDFYCPELRLAIEVDGGIHMQNNNIIYDKERQILLESLGIEFLRFTNTEIRNNTCKVLQNIYEKTNE